MLNKLKTIWKECFCDTDACIDFYFARRYRSENTLVHREDGNTVAMLSLLPATVVTDYVALQAHYVYAVATLPEYRNRGIGAQLSVQADKRMKAEGDSLAVLAPASESLFNYYTRLGYTTAFFRRVVTFPINSIEIIDKYYRTTITPFDEVEKLYALREQYFSRCGFFVRWDCEALRYAMDNCRMLGGEVFYVSDGCDNGYVFVEPCEEEGVVKIKETAITPSLSAALLAFLKTRYSNYKTLEFRLAVNSTLWDTEGQREPAAMLKWMCCPPQGIVTDNAYIGLLKD